MSIRKQMILYFSCVMVVIFTLTELINGWQTAGEKYDSVSQGTAESQC